MATHYWVAILR